MLPLNDTASVNDLNFSINDVKYNFEPKEQKDRAVFNVLLFKKFRIPKEDWTDLIKSHRNITHNGASDLESIRSEQNRFGTL